MSTHFTLGQSRVQWVTSGFMVAMTVSMLTTPWLLSRYGYRRVYEVCMWLLLGGGVVGGLANDFPLVMAARVAEGLAAGVVQPIPAIIILRAFASEEQGRADLRAFNETFVFLAAMTALALLASWKMAEPVASTAKD